jgi:hypothetical protein
MPSNCLTLGARDSLMEWPIFLDRANVYCSGEKLAIKASGDFKEEVGEGSKMHLQVKYGLITLINQERDACDTIEQADLKCPLKKGELSLTKDVALPREIPPVRTI